MIGKHLNIIHWKDNGCACHFLFFNAFSQHCLTVTVIAIFYSIHRIGQTRPVIVKRFIIKDSIEERIIANRRALAADRPTVSTQLDGTGLMEEEESRYNRPKKRGRHEDEDEMGEQTFQRLQQLEDLFGCSAFVNVTMA